MLTIKTNINEVIASFETKKQAIKEADFSQALLVGVNAAKATMQNRIFNRGLDANETSLGVYKRYRKARLTKIETPFKFSSFDALSPYEMKRVKKGRQVQYKDLEFLGDLRRGIVVLQVNTKRVVCAIPNEELFLISTYQEEQLRTAIFTLSEREKEILTKNVNAAIKQIYDRIFNP